MRIICLLVSLSAVAQAQQTMVPADLFYAVANVRDASTVTVGQAPERFLTLLPDGAEVLGTLGRVSLDGMVTDDVVPDRPTYATVVAQVTGGPSDVARSYVLDPPPGWRTHNTSPPPEGGFESNAPLGSGIVLCPMASGPNDEPVRVKVALRPGGGAYVTLSEGVWTRVRCDGTVDSPPNPFDDYGTTQVTLAALPVLSAPDRGRQQMGGSGGSNDYRRQEASLVWEGNALAALRHYESQFSAAGWVTLASGGGAVAAAGTWSRPSDEGTLTATVAVVRVEEDQFELRLTLASYGS